MVVMVMEMKSCSDNGGGGGDDDGDDDGGGGDEEAFTCFVTTQEPREKN